MKRVKGYIVPRNEISWNRSGAGYHEEKKYSKKDRRKGKADARHKEER